MLPSIAALQHHLKHTQLKFHQSKAVSQNNHPTADCYLCLQGMLLHKRKYHYSMQKNENNKKKVEERTKCGPKTGTKTVEKYTRLYML